MDILLLDNWILALLGVGVASLAGLFLYQFSKKAPAPAAIPKARLAVIMLTICSMMALALLGHGVFAPLLLPIVILASKVKKPTES